ncbi:Two-component system phosphate regulon sensor histidine kinase PhoR [Tenacibaculum sp. 190524A05c]|uniref:sensor histidine kinase n=1 Tax=Tenacibaculum platacis TaxID=3137852 RepID=UPI0031FB111D
MKSKKYNWILYFITATIITTIAVQFYWNYKNYQENKQRVMNEIQISLDNAVEQYFADLSKRSYFAIVTDKKDSTNKKKINNVWKNIFSKIDSNSNTSDKKKQELDSTSNVDFKITSIQFETDDENDFHRTTSVIDSIMCDTIIGFDPKYSKVKPIKGITQFHSNGKTGTHIESNAISDVRVFRGKRATDSLKLIKGLETIFVAVQNDTINPIKIDSILRKELVQKNINVNYGFQYFKSDTLQSDFLPVPIKQFEIIESKSTFLGPDKQFKMKYTNPSAEALRRSSTGIFLSLLLSLAVISSLFYLLRIINEQKELAEIKNDLISNITHEFKTPITTVSTALEAINNFNAIEDTEKTKKYVSISENQIKKLHLMVEKLLETATLDSEKLLLKKEQVEVINLLEKLSNKHQLLTNDKEIHFSSNAKSLVLNIDEFHFENAVSNLIDNAVKYGGDKIDVLLIAERDNITISVSDNGKGIDKSQQEKIFDKFYRIPKGNTHDVKGFGIGLYYTRKIIEKHLGSISLQANPGKTVFKINLTNE